MRKLKYLRNVVTLQLNEKRCIGCEMCVNVCPHAVFQMEGKRARIVNQNGCMECGACSRNCPTMAISVHAGIGCVTAIIKAAIRGTEPTCECGGKTSDRNQPDGHRARDSCESVPRAAVVDTAPPGAKTESRQTTVVGWREL